MLKRILNEPALLMKGRTKRLIIADLHMGLLSFPDRTIIENVSKLATEVDELIIAGDVKHDIGMRIREIKEVEELIKKLNENGIDKSRITIVKGNHDGGIDEVIKTESSRGIRIGNTGVFHGHAMPDDDVLSSKTLIFGHAHPAIFIKDSVGGVKERVWLEGNVEINGENKQVIVLPAFNDVCASTSVNLEKPVGVFFKLWNYFQAEAILLDGTLLGQIEHLR
jgi:hypothetical protein